MVDTPKEDNGEDKKDTGEDKPPEKQPKRQHQRRHSKPCHSKNSDTGTGDNSNPDDAEDNEEDPAQPGFEQARRGDGQTSPDEQATNQNSEEDNYMPPLRG